MSITATLKRREWESILKLFFETMGERQEMGGLRGDNEMGRIYNSVQEQIYGGVVGEDKLRPASRKGDAVTLMGRDWSLLFRNARWSLDYCNIWIPLQMRARIPLILSKLEGLPKIKEALDHYQAVLQQERQARYERIAAKYKRVCLE